MCCAVSAVGAGVVGGLVLGFVMGSLVKRNGKCGCRAKKSPQQNQQGKRAAGDVASARRPIPAGSVEIYAGNLSYEMTEAELTKMFGEYGKVDSARIVINRGTGKSKGFGFVVMPNRPEAEAAIAAFSEKEIMGRKMRVNEAKNTIVE